MKVFADFLNGIDDVEKRKKMEAVLNWVNNKFPNLAPEIRYNQPMFTDHDTFIIGFSVAKNHFAISPEKKSIEHFSNEIAKSGYEYTTNLMRIPWNEPIDYPLLEQIIKFNISDKKNHSAFWRK